MNGLKPAGRVVALDPACIGTPQLDGVRDMEGGLSREKRAELLGLAARSARISDYAKRIIEQDARRAARDGVTRGDACPHPYDTAEGQHFTAVFLLEGGRL